MYVDRKGMHCFLLADHEIYYNNWANDRVHQIPVNVDGSDQARAFKSIDICYLDDDDLNIFEVLIGSEDGQIFHACIQVTEDQVEILDGEFKQVLETVDFRPILDIKIAKINNNYLVLAVTDSSLYQLLGDD